MTYHTLRLEKAGHTQVLHLGDAAAPHGDISRARMAAEVTQACEEIDGDDETRVIVVAGCLDMPLAETAEETSPARVTPWWKFAEQLANVHKPLIAAIDGAAVGQGLELALACDIRMCADGCTFGMPHIRSGLMPWDGGTQRLPRVVGRANALRMLLTGAPIDAQEAHRIGLVSQVVPRDRLMPLVMDLAHEIASKAPIAVRYAKEAISDGIELTLDQGLRLEADLYFLLHTTHDRTAGIQAFREKKGARFEGR